MDLLLRLYELRREPTMREARNWFAREFNPDTADEVVQAMMGPNSGHFRMVTSYWDMAASFVLNGAIDEQMFNDANGEQLASLRRWNRSWASIGTAWAIRDTCLSWSRS